MNTQEALSKLCQCSDYLVAQLPEPAKSATLKEMRAAAQVLAQAIAPKPAAPPKPAPVVNPATGEAAPDFPATDPEVDVEVSDGNVA